MLSSKEEAEEALGKEAAYLFGEIKVENGEWTAVVEMDDDYGAPSAGTMAYRDGKWVVVSKPKLCTAWDDPYAFAHLSEPCPCGCGWIGGHNQELDEPCPCGCGGHMGCLRGD